MASAGRLSASIVSKFCAARIAHNIGDGRVMSLTKDALAAILDGIFAGLAVDRVVVGFPARKKIGPLAYADYALAADLGNGRLLYPGLAIGGTLVKLAALVIGLLNRASASLLTPLVLALVCGLLLLFVTRFAAPKMLKIGKTENKAEFISPLMEDFVKLSWLRARLII